MNKKLYNKIPGHVLVEEFLVPYFPSDISDLSNRAKINYWKLQGIIRGTEKIDKVVAEKLGTFFRNGAEYWLELQAKYERGEAL